MGNGTAIKITESIFGNLPETEKDEDLVVRQFTLSNQNGMKITVISYGASITSICVPDADGVTRDVVLSFDEMTNSHFKDPGGYGSAAGRVANFIAHGKFNLNCETYHVDKNHRGHHLHGGANGFHTKNWKSEVVDGNKVVMRCVSKDGEEGYPGEVQVTASYELTPDNQVLIKFEAIPNKSTPINMTSHGCFNLGGQEATDQRLVDHVIEINADKYTVPDSVTGIPNGVVDSVKGTNFDFTTPRNLNQVLEEFPPGPNGFNVNYCVNSGGKSKSDLNLVAIVKNVKNKIMMAIFSDQPGVQFYTGQHWPDKNEAPIIGKSGAKYMKYGFFALETQKYPNSVNVENFPTTIVKAGETYSHQIIYKFTLIDV